MKQIIQKYFLLLWRVFFNFLNSVLWGTEVFFLLLLILLKFNVSIFLYFAYVVTAIFAQVPSGEVITG